MFSSFELDHVIHCIEPENIASQGLARRLGARLEGRISVLMRGRGMKRCLAQGAERFELFVGAAVLANNLMKIGELLVKRAERRAKRTNR